MKVIGEEGRDELRDPVAVERFAAHEVAASSPPARISTTAPLVQNPVKFVWALAEEMKAADPNVTRKQIVDACIAKGVAFYTAKTKVQRFLKAKKTAGV